MNTETTRTAQGCVVKSNTTIDDTTSMEILHIELSVPSELHLELEPPRGKNWETGNYKMIGKSRARRLI